MAVLPALALFAAGCTSPGVPSAFPVQSVATTGNLYTSSSSYHDCVASVISSPTQDLLVTAAHCFSGTGRGITFVPGSVNGSQPFGRWTVTAAYVDPGWRTSRNPLRDVAILRVAPQEIDGQELRVQQVTGGNQLVTSEDVGGEIEVPAYTAGSGGWPFLCLPRAYQLDAYSAFDCGGYSNGTSGAPFLQGRVVFGVIGGLHQGGCYPSTSYSAPFDQTTLRTYARAVSGATPDTLPTPGSDGC